MLDFDAGKLLIIGLVALVVIGPKDLPRVLRQVGQAVAKLRRMAGEFQGQFMDAMKEADLQDIKTEISKLKDSATLDVDFDPARDVHNNLRSAFDVPPAKPVESVPAPLMTEIAPAGAGSEPASAALPSPSEVEPATTLAATGIGPVAVDEPAPPAPDHTPAVIEPIAPADATTSVAPAEREPDHASARRKIVVTRRRRLSRLDGPTLRAAALTGRSRNILPARLDTKDQ